MSGLRMELDGLDLDGEGHELEPDGFTIPSPPEPEPQGRTAGQLLRDALERVLGPTWADRLWPIEDQEPEPDVDRRPTEISVPLASTRDTAITLGRLWLAEWNRTRGADLERIRVRYEDVSGRTQTIDVDAGPPFAGVVPGGGQNEPAPRTDREEPQMDQSGHGGGETPEMRASRRLDTAQEIPHTPEQAERARRGARRASVRITADGTARGTTVVGQDGKPLLATAVRFEQRVGEAPRAEVDTVLSELDYEGPAEIKEAPAQADAIRRLEAIRQDVAEALRHAITRPETVHEVLKRIEELAGDAPLPDTTNARVENTALRAEVDRLRRVNENLVEQRDKRDLDVAIQSARAREFEHEVERQRRLLDAERIVSEARKQYIEEHPDLAKPEAEEAGP